LKSIFSLYYILLKKRGAPLHAPRLELDQKATHHPAPISVKIPTSYYLHPRQRHYRHMS